MICTFSELSVFLVSFARYRIKRLLVFIKIFKNFGAISAYKKTEVDRKIPSRSDIIKNKVDTPSIFNRINQNLFNRSAGRVLDPLPLT